MVMSFEFEIHSKSKYNHDGNTTYSLMFEEWQVQPLSVAPHLIARMWCYDMDKWLYYDYIKEEYVYSEFVFLNNV